MPVAFGVFANAKIQCEESVSSSTPQNCATTSRFFVNAKRLFSLLVGFRNVYLHNSVI